MLTIPSAPQYSKPMAASWSGSTIRSTSVVKSQMRLSSRQMVAAVLQAARSSTSHPCALRYLSMAGPQVRSGAGRWLS